MLDVSTGPYFKRSYIHSKETQHIPDAKTNTVISWSGEKDTHTNKCSRGHLGFCTDVEKTYEKENYSTNDNGEAGFSGRMK